VQRVPNLSADGPDFNISVRLWATRTGSLLWSQTLQREQESLLNVPREIAREVAARIHITLSEREQIRLSSPRQADPDAVELYLKGRSSRELRQSQEFYRQAISKDPNFADAHATLAIGYTLLSGYSGEMASGEAYRAAMDADERALEIDDTLAEAWTARGRARYLLGWDWEGLKATSGEPWNSILFHRSCSIGPRII